MSKRCFKLLTLAASALFFASKVHATNTTAVFLMNSGIRCTGTMLKIDNACHLLTNGHCVGAEDKSHLSYAITATDSTGFDEATDSVSQLDLGSAAVDVPVQRLSRYLDLAELEMPQDLKNFCDKNLANINPKQMLPPTNYAVTFQAVGYVNQVPTRRFSRDLPWSQGYAPSAWQFYPYSMTPLLNLLRVGGLHVTPGMSGGPIVNNVTGFTGMVSRYLPFQNVAYVIPSNVIEYFLSVKTAELLELEKRIDPTITPKGSLDLTDMRSNTLAMSGDNLLLAGGDNTHALGGDNTHVLGGDNTHVLGGDNTHVLGGDNTHALGGDLGLNNMSPLLKPFQEPLEGVTFAQNSERILLAVNGVQVDGYDDALLQQQGYAGSAKRYITRARDGYPDEGFRKQIFERLDGYYRSNPIDEDGTHEFAWAVNPKEIEGYSALTRGSPMMDIDIDAKKKRLHLMIWTHPVEQINNAFASVQIPKVEINLTYELDAEGKMITLKSGGVALLCDNRNYLKLICSSETLLFSVSRRGVTEEELDVRVAVLSSLKDVRFVQMITGRFYATRDVEEFRKMEDR